MRLVTRKGRASLKALTSLALIFVLSFVAAASFTLWLGKLSGLLGVGEKQVSQAMPLRTEATAPSAADEPQLAAPVAPTNSSIQNKDKTVEIDSHAQANADLSEDVQGLADTTPPSTSEDDHSDPSSDSVAATSDQPMSGTRPTSSDDDDHVSSSEDVNVAQHDVEVTEASQLPPESRWIREFFEGPYRFRDGQVYEYLYRASFTRAEQVTRYGRLQLSPVEGTVFRFDRPEKVLEDRKRTLGLSAFPYIDKPDLSRIDHETESYLGNHIESGSVLAASSGHFFFTEFSNFLEHFAEAPIDFIVADIHPALTSDEWTVDTLSPVRINRVLEDPYRNYPRATARRSAPQGPIQIGGTTFPGRLINRAQVVARTDRYFVVTMYRELEVSRDDSRFIALQGNEVIAFDQALGLVTYRRFVGVSQETADATSASDIDYELHYQTSDPDARQSMIAAMNWNSAIKRLATGPEHFPVSHITTIRTAQQPAAHSLSRDGRWLIEHNRMGMRLRDLEQEQSDVVEVLPTSRRSIAWDRNSRGFAYVAEQDQKLGIEWIVFGDPGGIAERGFVPVVSVASNRTIVSCAFDVQQRRVLVQHEGVWLDYSLDAQSPRWTAGRHRYSRPLAYEWRDSDIVFYLPSEIISIDLESGNPSVLKTWKPAHVDPTGATF